jgi:hypothetical protein
MRASAIILTAIGLATLPATAKAQDWELARTQGLIRLVVIPKAKEREYTIYEDAIRTLCPADQHCGVQFWSERRHVRSGSLLDMSDAQSDARLAAYIQNPKTRHKELIYHCRIKPDPRYCSGR